jgi:hypothetical protein
VKPPPIVVALVLAFALTIALGACGTTEGPVTTGTSASSTTTSPGTSTTIGESTTSTSSISTSTSTTGLAGPPGDSPGAWVEVDLPEIAGRASWVALSDVALLVQTDSGGIPALKAYLLDSAQLVELPAESPMVSLIDIDGNLAVWAEGRYDESTATVEDQYVFAYPLPDGPKVKVTGNEQAPFYPQVAPGWISWMETGAEDPSGENRELRILGIEIDASGNPVGQPVEFVPSAVATVVGDSVWTYSLSSTKLAWEQHLAAGDIAAGSYLMDLGTHEVSAIGGEAWRPSLAGDLVVYSEDGLKMLEMSTGDVRELDARGDFASAAATFAAYFRTADDGGYDIVARGFTGAYEQVLSRASEPPWLASSIAVSNHYVACIVDGSARLFRWQAKA